MNGGGQEEGKSMRFFSCTGLSDTVKSDSNSDLFTQILTVGCLLEEKIRSAYFVSTIPVPADMALNFSCTASNTRTIAGSKSLPFSFKIKRTAVSWLKAFL